MRTPQRTHRRLGRSPKGLALLDELLPEDTDEATPAVTDAPVATPPPEPAAPVVDFWSPYLTEDEVLRRIGGATPPAAPPPPPPADELPPPPPQPAGERVDWSLHGIDTDPVTTTIAAPVPPPTTPAASDEDPEPPTERRARPPWRRRGSAAANDEPAEPVEHRCPTCSQPAHIDLLDRRRGIQHLSCGVCFKMWQERLAA